MSESGVSEVAMVNVAARAVAAVPVWQLPDADLTDLVQQTETTMRVLAALQLGAIGEGIKRGLPLSSGSGTGTGAPGRWVRSLIAITPGDAAFRVGLATTVFTGPDAERFAPTRQALLDGSISAGHARHITAALADLAPPAVPDGLIDDPTRAEAQHLLLALASGSGEGPGAQPALDPTQTARAATALTATLDPAAGARLAADEDRQHSRRCFTLTPLPSGMFHAAGLLTKQAGHALSGVLHTLAAPRPATDGTPDPRTGGMRLHDALEQAACRLTTTGALPGSHGTPHRLVVSVDIHTLAAHLGSELTGGAPIDRDRSGAPRDASRSALTGGLGTVGLPPAELPGRWPLSPLGAQTMSCDADLVAVLVGPDGTPLDVADTLYSFPAKQRTAVIDRDRHCTYPTCTAPAPWCDVHHLQSFGKGGATSVTNGALLCGAHHRYVHAKHLTGTMTTGGAIAWQAPTGITNTHSPPPAAHRAITALANSWRQRQRSPSTGT